MAAPFVAHFDHGHLEESPGQQANDVLNVGQYVQTHTVLVEQMLAPALSVALAAPTGIDPFVAHFDHAHLEESPGQQASDLTNTDQYVKTHTVLIEQMLAPAADAAMGSNGC